MGMAGACRESETKNFDEVYFSVAGKLS